MSVLLYAPGVKAAISTKSNGIIDVSEDLVAGTLTLTENQPSTFDFQLANHRRKYDGIFTPNDRIVVQMRRVGAYLQVFSGYLDQVPYFSIYPRTVKLSSTCTLKRLKYRLWDAGAQESFALIQSSFNADNMEVSDHGVKTKVVDLLVQVAEWPKEQIHIGMLPPKWFDRISDLYTKLGDRIGYSKELMGDGATIAGETVGTGSGGTWTGGTGVLTPDQFAALILGQGGTPNEAIALAGVAATESGFNVQAEQKGGKGRGLFQIDLGQHPNITQAQAYDPVFATKWALDAIRARVKQGKSLIQACGDSLFYGPGDNPKRAEEGRQAVAAVCNASQPKLGQIPPGASVPAPVSSPPVVKDGLIAGASGLRWTSGDKLAPNVYAARQFVEQNWPKMKGSIGGFATSGHAANSDHYTGHALDLMVSHGDAQGEERRMGNSMAKWFVENPNVFGVKYVIWYKKMLDTRSGGGWKAYPEKGNSSGNHTNHVHVSFLDAAAMGPSGSPLTGAAAGPFDGGFLDGTGVAVGGVGTPGAQGGLGVSSSPGSPLNVYSFIGSPSPESSLLSGYRAIMNDDPILDFIGTLMGVSMRSYMSAPNGDFIGWFPDYFGIYGTGGKMIIQDIELEDFSIVWSDTRLITHQFTAGSPYNSPQSLGGAVNSAQKFMTAGIVSVEFPEVMEALLNIKPGEGAFGDAQKILQRFGARKSYESMGTITGKEAEFWYAVSLFQRNWAEQFSTNVPITFMPELFPGMLMQMPAHKLQVYVTQVTHSFDFREGGGFTTSATTIAPSSMEGGGIYGLPKSL